MIKMKGKEYIKKLNALEAGMREEREAVYEEYGDHSDDAELCWSQRRQYWDSEIDEIAEEADAAGFPVWYDSDRREWILK